MAFGYYRQLSFDRTKCGASNLSSFPVLVSIVNAAFGSHVSSPSGFDIVFSTDKAGASKVPWEIEFFDKPSGTLVAWVNVATLNGSAAAANSSLYMCYGDATITTAQNTPTQVWDANYAGVWHLGNGTTLSGNDSTANANHASGLNGTIAAAGQIDGGASFNGSTTYVNIPTSATTSPASALTLSCWAKAVSSSLQEYIIKWASNNYYFLRINASNAVEFSVNHLQTLAFTASYVGVWMYFAGTFDGSIEKLYTNGVLRTSATITSATDVNTAPINFGGIGSFPTQMYQGIMDECRLSLVARSADWIVTEYNNQNAPGNIGADNFVIFGAETTAVQRQPVAVVI
jgi:hypothetical protein